MRDEDKMDDANLIPKTSPLLNKLKRALRGEVSARTVALETLRRSRVLLQVRRERATLKQLDQRPARLRKEFARLSPSDLLLHFRTRKSPRFLPGFGDSSELTAQLQQELFADETTHLIENANRISSEHRWPLLGYGELAYGDPIDWRRDLISNEVWPLDYHVDLNLARESMDVRVLWELNRLSHFVTLGRAYAVTRDELLAEEFFVQLESWRMQNPVGRGPSWACAMEVALRAMNLLAAFELFRSSPALDENRLMQILAIFEAHGSHIRRNFEFSYIATSNHYLSDVVGLMWLGIMLPELAAGDRWREIGKREVLREMEVQILDDGADFESSTGYHRFVLELFLYSFILCRANQIEMPERFWRKLLSMLIYLRNYTRPDGRAPLIGDTDSGQALPIVKRTADDHSYLLAVGAAFLQDSGLKPDNDHGLNEELLWILGPEGVRRYQELAPDRDNLVSKAFTDAGTFILRKGDLYLLLNTSGSGVKGRGSHGHNDALSIEVSVCGTSFIVDPGTYVYRTDLHERHLFRSTAYHSTIEIDGAEQNTTNEDMPFVIGNEARPRVLIWETSNERDCVVAEHDGYARFGGSISHRRTVEFNKRDDYWIVEDLLTGIGNHAVRVFFQFSNDVDVNAHDETSVQALHKKSGAWLYVMSIDLNQAPALESRFISREYGAKIPSIAAVWDCHTLFPVTMRWAIVPVCPGADPIKRLEVVQMLRK